MAEAAKTHPAQKLPNRALGETNWNEIDLDLKREGEKIVLPANPTEMSIEEGIEALERIKKAQNTVYDINETINVHFYDGLVALAHVLKEKYGYAGATSGTVDTFFGKMKVPPKLIHVRTGAGRDDFVQVPFGGFNFPGVEGQIETKYGVYKDIPVLRIQGQVKAVEKKIVMEIVTAVQDYAKHNSIYKGRSIILERDESGGIDYNKPLEFFNPHEGSEVPIFDRETERLIETAMLTPIKNSQVCRDMNIPLKRGVLLEGPYGTGKSLTAKQAAKVATENGWTFILVTAASALKYGLKFAKMYQPCVVFAEDIDRITGDRNEGANDLINDIDGVVGKNDEIITVLTTNFAENIDKAMLRPGRLDTVVSLRPPKADAIERLIRFYAGSKLETAADLTATCEMLSGQIPATIREVVERSKLFMIESKGTHITAEDLEVSARGMKNHMELIDNAKEGLREPKVDDLLKNLVREMAFEAIEKFHDEN